MERGYVKLWRKSLESRIFSNPELWKVWSWCLLKASHKSRWVSINVGQYATDVEVGPGQFIYGRHSAAAELGMPASSVRNRMEKLKKIGNLDILKDSHYSIVTICKWEQYQPQREENGQAKGQPEDSRRTAVGHKQKGKEGKEENIGPSRFTPPTREEVRQYAEKVEYPLDPDKFISSYEQKGWMIGKSRMKDWKAAVRNWKANGWGKLESRQQNIRR